MTSTKGRTNQDNSKTTTPGIAGLVHDDLRRVHDHSPMAVLAIDRAGAILYANKAAQSLFNVPEGGLSGQSVFSHCRDESDEKLNESRIRQQEEILDQEFSVIAKPEGHCVLISSLVYSDRQNIVETYLFIRDISKVKKRENLFSYLNQAATALAGTRDTASALEQIARFIVPRFANWFTVDVLKENRLELLLLKHEDPEKIKWAYRYRQQYPNDPNGGSGPAVVLRSGKPAFIPVVTQQMIDASIHDSVQRREVNKIGLHSVIIVPMSAGERVTGLVNFISSQPGRHFDEADLAFAQNFAGLIGLDLENARLNEDAEREIGLRKQSESRFRFLTDAIPHKLWTSAPDGHATYYNRQWHDYTGINGFEALREKIWDFIHPDDRALAATEWPAAIAKGEPTEMEHRLMRDDGAYRWHLSRFLAYKNSEGQVDLWVGTSTDIHEQKMAGIALAAANEELTAANEELAALNEEFAATNEELVATQRHLERSNMDLARSEKLFRSIALNIPGSVIIVVDKNHRYVAVEGDILEKMGYDRRNYEGKHPREAGSPERYEASRHLYERVLAGEKFSLERKAENGDTYMVHFVPLKDENEEVNAGLIIALDITDIKQAEERSAKLAAIVESSDDAIVGKTLESVITSWNHSAERMFGYTADEMIGESIYRIIPTDRQEEEPQILNRLKQGQRVEHFETQRLTKDGRLLDVSLTISAVKDKEGNIIGLSKIARDITAKKQEEQRKNDFIGMVSHELKTPLTSLNGIIQVTRVKLKDNEDAFLANAMERAGVQVKRMTAMINGFLNVSRLEAGKMSLECQVFEIGELLNETVEEAKLIVNTHSLSLNGSGPVWVDADRDKISSVVTNLIGNAVKYSPKGRPVEITYRSSGAEVTVAIKDEGIGISAVDISKIFDRYHRIETEHSRHVSGFGIGLYLSAEIIERHQGRIWAESVDGRGSTFYFALPQVQK